MLPGKLARQAWTQVHRRSPVNLRGVCGIKPTLNAKGVALFAMGNREPAMLDLLKQCRQDDGGWGYPFAWQSRAFYAPPGRSNLICTAFAVHAHRELGCGADVDTGFVERELIREREGERWITYVPGTDTQVHNINMIGAALLGRRDCMEFSVRRQRADGAWWYGESANQRWVDNFHTGFSLVAVREMGGFEEAERKGFAYWDRTFWTEDFAPRYFEGGLLPLDIHCCAQGVVTYLAFGQVEKARRVAQWALDNMWDERGYFWYQRTRWWTTRICYMRWAQAWMYYALAKLLRAEKGQS
jgi:hypothetical protein